MSKFISSIFIASLLVGCKVGAPQSEYKYDSGFVFGTDYNFVYRADVDYNDTILERLKLYDASLSTYNGNSIISRVNRNDSVVVDSFFTYVYNKAKEFYRLSEGCFDISVEPLSALWKFGKNHSDTISVDEYNQILSKVDSVRDFIGLEKTELRDGQIIKADDRIRLNACALAEGFGIDIAASVLEEHGVTDYMVEIGGELHTKGNSPSGRAWRIGVDKPIEGSDYSTRSNQIIVAINDGAISTSGSYRQFYYTADGRRLSHTIDPRTGQPIEHNTISVTVVGPNTITTDALATTFMVLGYERGLALADSIDGIDAFFVFEVEKDSFNTVMTNGFKRLILE